MHMRRLPYALPCDNPKSQLTRLRSIAGMAVLPGALTAAEQRRVVRDALTAFPEPPNATNHTAHLGQLPSLWDASLRVRFSLRPPRSGWNKAGCRVASCLICTQQFGPQLD